MELAARKLHAVRVGSAMHIFDDANAPAIRKKIGAALRRGATAIHISDGGWSEWIESVPIEDTSKEGSAVYEWDTSGDKVRCHRYRCECRDGVVERTEIGTSYRRLD